MTWEELKTMTQDRDNWIRMVKQMQAQAKARIWVESNERKKKEHKTLKEEKTPTTLRIYYTFHTNCATVTTPPAGFTDRARVIQRKAVNQEFLTGTTEDRQNLQRQAKIRKTKSTTQMRHLVMRNSTSLSTGTNLLSVTLFRRIVRLK